MTPVRRTRHLGAVTPSARSRRVRGGGLARHALAAAVGAMLVAGCTVGPDYTRPAIDTPARFTYAPKDAADVANSRWWQQFGDPVLDALIAEALAHNQNVKVAAGNVEAAAGILTQTRSAAFPQVGYDASAGRTRSSEAGVAPELAARIPNPQGAYQALLQASWEIDLWGRIRRLSEAARANLLATDEARKGVILTLVAGVATNYLTLRGLDQQLVVAKQTLAAYGESLQLFKLQFQYGQISQMNVAQVQSQYETAATQIPQIEAQIAQTELALGVLLGRNPGPIPRGRSIYELALPAVPAGLPSQLLTRRPDLVQAENELIAANAQIGAARALYFPTISLTGGGGTASASLADLFHGPARVWSYAGALAGPIFTFGAVSGQVAQAEGAREAAVANYRYAIQNAFAEVDTSLLANQKVQEQLAAQQRLVDALKDYARLAHLQYDGGYTSYTTVLQAEQQLFPAELALAAVRASTFSSSVAIYKAMGGGWIVDADRMTGNAAPPPATRATGMPPLF